MRRQKVNAAMYVNWKVERRDAVEINYQPHIPNHNTESVEQRLQKMSTEAVKEEQQALKKATEDFEAIFLTMMFKNMRNTVPDGGLMEKSFGRGIYEEMQDEQMAEEISASGGVGLAKELYQQLSQQRGYEEAAANLQESTIIHGDAKGSKDLE